MLNWVPRRVRLVSAAKLRATGDANRFRVKLERPTGEAYVGGAGGGESAATEVRAAAEATLEALRQVVGQAVDVKLQGVLPLSAFGNSLIVVAIKVTHEQQTHELFGLCPITEDRGRAAALATLNAVNRFLGLG